ncbi:hypothetical protein AA13595_0561 [Gluconacetobacter johannae DSM 13595]|uniref:HutD family protein n=1 Tax=Gluconacetobacter johannae TaxID=112140 RepID=A0A7W4JA06_9PROT|nr:HutD family protein [Gluconacetobacter johannae]MBB2177381.1 HutD family protein [Gluconacetobacter johannae]GBQ81217.1 hypothetical protein AA13595_0561 [Gluconacetobacter johannae DSM 13595]
MKPDPENDNLFPSAPYAEAISSQPSRLWKNGGGLTKVIADHADWRLSVADISRDGAFSHFPGIVRHIALLEGAGARLSLSDGTKRDIAGTGDAHTFSGDLSADVALVSGPVRVVNLMHPPSRPYRLEAVQAPCQCVGEASLAGALVVVRGRWVLETASGRKQSCQAGEFLLLPEGTGGILSVEDGDDPLLYRVAPIRAQA